MSEELKDFQTAPTLTLNPFAEEEKAQPEVKKEEPLMDENVLSEEERKMADQFANQIDLTNSAMILQYGAGTQSKMADFSETALENVKTKDLGEVGELLGNVVKELKNFDEEEEKGFFGIFKKQANKIQALKTKYAKAETNINQICQALEGHQVQLMKDVAILDKMYELNLTYFKELRCIFWQERKSERSAGGTVERTPDESADQRTCRGCTGSKRSGGDVRKI